MKATVLENKVALPALVVLISRAEIKFVLNDE